MKKGMEIPPAVIVVVLIVVVALIGYFGSKAILPPQRVQMSPEAIKGMKEHTGVGAGTSTQKPGGMSAQHSQ